MHCRICSSSNLTSDLHVPNHSKIELRIVQCNDCGLVQGMCDENMYSIENDTFKDPSLILSKISCDSPYSNIRVGKQQMAAKFFNIVDQLPFDLDDIKSVIDVRAARGSFIVNAPHKFTSASIFVGLEQDLYLHPTAEVYNSSQIKIFDGSIYNYLGKPEGYDFVYSCHTLEHYRDPNKYIRHIKKLMSPNGYFFLDVPAIEDFIDDDLLDDFFYDKHLLYFSKQRLVTFLEAHDLNVIWSRSSGNGCLEVLAQVNSDTSSDKSIESQFSSSNTINPSQISDYSVRLKSNRSLLPKITRNIMNYISSVNCNICAFGAGRILDSFVVYGGLNVEAFDYFIDNFLYDASDSVNGLNICRFSDLDLSGDSIFILFTRKNSDSLHKLIESKFPDAKIFHWSQFIDSKNSLIA